MRLRWRVGDPQNFAKVIQVVPPMAGEEESWLAGWHEKLLVPSPDHPSGSVGPGAPSHPEGRREVERNKKKMKGEWGANTEGAERRPDEVSISDPGMLWPDLGRILHR